MQLFCFSSSSSLSNMHMSKRKTSIRMIEFSQMRHTRESKILFFIVDLFEDRNSNIVEMKITS